MEDVMDELVKVEGQTEEITTLTASARDYAALAKSQRTRRIYHQEWKAFEAWAVSQRLQVLPCEPRTLALYLTAKSARRKVAGLTLALAAISQVHKAKGFQSPRGAAEVQEVMKGIRRSLGVAQVQKAPVLVSDLRAMIAALPVGVTGLRDRALLLVGFAGAFGRSELVGLDIADVNFAPEGLEITLRRSKTDQEGEGRKIGLPYGSNPSTCPVRSLQAWLNASAPQGTTSGPIFREVRPDGRTVMAAPLTGQSVAIIVKRAAKAAGLDPTMFSGHSLRAGLATSAAKAGKSERAIMAQTGHRSEKMVRRYIRDANLFQENAAAGLL
jgi:integrase